jgi:hypothetical protein
VLAEVGSEGGASSQQRGGDPRAEGKLEQTTTEDPDGRRTLESIHVDG